MLSPRIVHFGPMELYWECNQGLFCECRPHEGRVRIEQGRPRLTTVWGLRRGLWKIVEWSGSSANHPKLEWNGSESLGWWRYLATSTVFGRKLFHI
ncbi:uncharacterized protein BDZ99DRAFT_66467 [Mytilinidion resinicola]|uniref:Uncharacterized protein n=1 Tax=Mytilinidion resinicola TaxID=574789 RepID=A0A6A6YG72_9PEZI|nr:uncharacterized protein BDZ99DRAFT_66467 [Mytilinidion resinicola]KAF2807816.1 hypothetical protein BDZ99DRAFT_66467 [Mytilinidion resinicola]